MSHFSVLVIGEDVKGQMAPYQENNMGDCPRQYLRFHNASIDRERAKRGQKRKGRDRRRTRVQVAEAGYWENPRKKWDYWRIGGRWGGMLRVRDPAMAQKEARSWDGPAVADGFTSQARLCEIDWDGMRAARAEQQARAWAEYEAEVRKGTKDGIARYMFGIKPAETKEQYLARAEEFSTFAVLKEGEWYQRGRMGWFAMVSEEKADAEWREEFHRLLNGLPPDALLTVVDCHI